MAFCQCGVLSVWRFVSVAFCHIAFNHVAFCHMALFTVALCQMAFFNVASRQDNQKNCLKSGLCPVLFMGNTVFSFPGNYR